MAIGRRGAADFGGKARLHRDANAIPACFVLWRTDPAPQ
jgi:hypothetical protein